MEDVINVARQIFVHNATGMDVHSVATVDVTFAQQWLKVDKQIDCKPSSMMSTLFDAAYEMDNNFSDRGDIMWDLKNILRKQSF